jgi:hypothetical protein
MVVTKSEDQDKAHFYVLCGFLGGEVGSDCSSVYKFNIKTG